MMFRNTSKISWSDIYPRTKSDTVWLLHRSLRESGTKGFVRKSVGSDFDSNMHSHATTPSPLKSPVTSVTSFGTRNDNSSTWSTGGGGEASIDSNCQLSAICNSVIGLVASSQSADLTRLTWSFVLVELPLVPNTLSDMLCGESIPAFLRVMIMNVH